MASGGEVLVERLTGHAVVQPELLCVSDAPSQFIYALRSSCVALVRFGTSTSKTEDGSHSTKEAYSRAMISYACSSSSSSSNKDEPTTVEVSSLLSLPTNDVDVFICVGTSESGLFIVDLPRFLARSVKEPGSHKEIRGSFGISCRLPLRMFGENIRAMRLLPMQVPTSSSSRHPTLVVLLSERQFEGSRSSKGSEQLLSVMDVATRTLLWQQATNLAKQSWNSIGVVAPSSTPPSWLGFVACGPQALHVFHITAELKSHTSTSSSNFLTRQRSSGSFHDSGSSAELVALNIPDAQTAERWQLSSVRTTVADLIKEMRDEVFTSVVVMEGLEDKDGREFYALALSSTGMLLAVDVKNGSVVRWMDCRLAAPQWLCLHHGRLMAVGAVARLFDATSWTPIGKMKPSATGSAATSRHLSSSPSFSSFVSSSALPNFAYVAGGMLGTDRILLFGARGDIAIFHVIRRAPTPESGGEASWSIRPLTAVKASVVVPHAAEVKLVWLPTEPDLCHRSGLGLWSPEALRVWSLTSGWATHSSHLAQLVAYHRGAGVVLTYSTNTFHLTAFSPTRGWAPCAAVPLSEPLVALSGGLNPRGRRCVGLVADGGALLHLTCQWVEGHLLLEPQEVYPLPEHLPEGAQVVLMGEEEEGILAITSEAVLDLSGEAAVVLYRSPSVIASFVVAGLHAVLLLNRRGEVWLLPWQFQQPMAPTRVLRHSGMLRGLSYDPPLDLLLAWDQHQVLGWNVPSLLAGGEEDEEGEGPKQPPPDVVLPHEGAKAVMAVGLEVEEEEEATTEDVDEDEDEMRSVKTVVVVCDECGFVAQYAVGTAVRGAGWMNSPGTLMAPPSPAPRSPVAVAPAASDEEEVLPLPHRRTSASMTPTNADLADRLQALSGMFEEQKERQERDHPRRSSSADCPRRRRVVEDDDDFEEEAVPRTARPSSRPRELGDGLRPRLPPLAPKMTQPLLSLPVLAAATSTTASSGDKAASSTPVVGEAGAILTGMSCSALNFEISALTIESLAEFGRREGRGIVPLTHIGSGEPLPASSATERTSTRDEDAERRPKVAIPSFSDEDRVLQSGALRGTTAEPLASSSNKRLGSGLPKQLRALRTSLHAVTRAMGEVASKSAAATPEASVCEALDGSGLDVVELEELSHLLASVAQALTARHESVATVAAADNVVASDATNA